MTGLRAVYYVVAAIPELGALPGDHLSVDWGDEEHPYRLVRLSDAIVPLRDPRLVQVEPAARLAIVR
jgi:hypothetical protein